MASIDDLLDEMRSNPGGVRFADAWKVVTSYSGEPSQGGTSHKVWKMHWAGDPRVNMQRAESGKAKAYQVRQAVQAIDRLIADRAARAAQVDEHDERNFETKQTQARRTKAKAKTRSTKKRRR